MSERIHLATANGYACGVERVWPSCVISSVRTMARVTCRNCRRSATPVTEGDTE